MPTIFQQKCDRHLVQRFLEIVAVRIFKIVKIPRNAPPGSVADRNEIRQGRARKLTDCSSPLLAMGFPGQISRTGQVHHEGIKFILQGSADYWLIWQLLRWLVPRSTYDRHSEQFDRYEAILDYGCAALVARFLGT